MFLLYMPLKDKRILSKNSKELQKELNDLIISEIDKKLKSEHRKLVKLQKKYTETKDKIVKTKKYKENDFNVDLT